MSETNRPGSVTFVAVMSIVLAFCCGSAGVITLMAPEMMEEARTKAAAAVKIEMDKQRNELQARRQSTRDPNALAQIDQQLEVLDNFPDLEPILQTMFSLSVQEVFQFEGLMAMASSLALLIAAFGMFGLAGWARMVAMTAAAVRIGTALVSLVLFFAVVIPAIKEGMRQVMEAFAKLPNVPPPQDVAGRIASEGAVYAVLATLLLCAWPTVVLIVLNTRDVKRAFGAGRIGRVGGFGIE